MASGVIPTPVAFISRKGAPTKRNSYALSRASSSRSTCSMMLIPRSHRASVWNGRSPSMSGT